MAKKVLDVGQCDPDHGSLTRFLKMHFEVEIDRSHVMDDTLQKVSANDYDLILVNRKLDQNYEEGLDIIKAIKADPKTSDIPCMIVSNFEDSQKTAVEAGAAYGFGKSQLDDQQTIDRVAAILN